MKPSTINVSFDSGYSKEARVDASVDIGKDARLYVRPILDPSTLAALKGAVMDAAKWALEQERQEAAKDGGAP